MSTRLPRALLVCIVSLVAALSLDGDSARPRSEDRAAAPAPVAVEPRTTPAPNDDARPDEEAKALRDVGTRVLARPAGPARGVIPERSAAAGLKQRIDATRAILAAKPAPNRVALQRNVDALEDAFARVGSELDQQGAVLESIAAKPELAGPDADARLAAFRDHRAAIQAQAKSLVQKLRAGDADPAAMAEELGKVASFREMKSDTRLAPNGLVDGMGTKPPSWSAGNVHGIVGPGSRPPAFDNAGMGDVPSFEGAAPPLDPADVQVIGAFQPSLPPPAVTNCTTNPGNSLCAQITEGAFTPAILAKVAALGSDPYRIYTFVRNEIEFEPYIGVNKNADAVLQTRKGGVQEQMLLLGTMLRAAGFPTQYAFNYVYAPIEQIMSVLGQKTVEATQDLVDFSFPRVARYDAQNNLIGYYLYLSWVEAYVPYGGRFADANERRWVPLMPYWAQTDLSDGHPEATATTPFDETAFLSSVSTQTADESHRDALVEAAAASNAGYGAEEIGVRRTEKDETIGVLPATLPVEVVNANSIARLSGMPSNYVLKAYIVVYNHNGSFNFGNFLSMPFHGLRRITISWQASTATDQAIINAYGGLANTPPGAVLVRPSLRSDGSQITLGGAMVYGNFFNVQMYFRQFESADPNSGFFSTRDKWRPVGTFYNLGYDGMQFSKDYLTQREAQVLSAAAPFGAVFPQDHVEALTGGLLHAASVKYFLDNDAVNTTAGDLYQFQRIRRPQHQTTESEVQALYLFDRPYLVVPIGAVLDAWSLSSGAFSLYADYTKASELTRVRAYASSALEHMLWEHFITIESVSTTKLLQRANEINMPVFDFAPFTPAATIYASLNLNSFIEDSIVDSCTINGARVVVHQSDQTINQWTGAGWFEELPNGGFGMLISGSLNAVGAVESGSVNGGAIGEQIDKAGLSLSLELAGLEAGGTGQSINNGGAGTENPPQGVDPNGANDGTGQSGNNHDDPVNLVTGNRYERVTDVKIRSVHYPLMFTRAYNSQLAYSGPLGQRWTHTYNSMVMPTANPGELRYIDEVGGSQIFVETSPGSLVWKGPAGFEATITQVGSQITHRSKHGFERVHDAATGHLLRTNARDAEHVLTYDGGGRLIQVADEFGASLAFTNDASGRIVSMVDHTGRAWSYQYSAAGDLTKVTSPSDASTAAGIWSYGYDTAHRMTTRTNPLGGITTADYYSDGKLHKQVFPDGRAFTYVYDATYRGRTEVVNPDASVDVFIFDPVGNRLEERLADGSVWKHVFDADKNMTATVDPFGNTSTYTWDAASNLTSATSALGITTTFAYDPVFNLPTDIADDFGPAAVWSYDSIGNIVSATDASGAQTSATYNANGQITSFTDADNKTALSQYDAAGRVTTSTDRRGLATNMVYDALNRPTQVTLPDGTIYTFSWDVRDRLVAVFAGATQITDLDYDAAGNVLSSTDAVGSTTTTAYDTNGDKTAVAFADGQIVTFTYDARKRMVSMVDSAGPDAVREYDGIGRIVSFTDKEGRRWDYARDGRGMVVETIDPLGRSMGKEYDADGRLVRRSFANGTEESFTYNDSGMMTSAVDRAGGTTTWTYDARRLVTQIEDPLGNTLSTTYDVLGRPVTLTDALGNVISRTHDANGNVTSITDGRGITSTLTYDLRNRPTIRVVTDAQANVIDTIQTAWSSRGDILSASDGDTAVTFTYDAARRVTTAATSATLVQPASSISFTHDTRNRVVSMTDPIGQAMGYSYDLTNQLVGVVGQTGAATAFSYDSRRYMVAATRDNGVTSGYARDDAGQLTALLHKNGETDIGSMSFTYDVVGNITSRSQTSGTDAYGYDAANRVTSATHPSAPAESWTHDLAGNWLTSHASPGYTVGLANQLLSDGTYSYAYDGAGNRISKVQIANPGNHTSFTYDYDNRLTGVVEYAGGAPILTASYAYDALGRRVQKDVNGTIRRYVYDSWNIVAEYDGSNQLVARYVHDARQVDRPVAMIKNGQTFYYHQDQVGSVVALTDATGSVVQRYRYDTFGQRTFTLDGSFEQPFGFDGREQDETGLIHMRHRDYDPKVGRFVQRDPIGLAGGINLYVFVENDPLRYFDPYGQVKWWDAVLAVGGIVGGAVTVLCGGVIAGVGAPTPAAPLAVIGGGALVLKGSYAVGANAQNLWAALWDEDGPSTGALLPDVAKLAFPNNPDAEKLATALDLATDLMVPGDPLKFMKGEKFLNTADNWGTILDSGNTLYQSGDELHLWDPVKKVWKKL